MVDLTQFIKHDIKTIRQGEPDFQLTDGLMLYPRAMLHILPECPSNVREMINWAVSEGYVKCVAHVRGKELTWERLSA